MRRNWRLALCCCVIIICSSSWAEHGVFLTYSGNSALADKSAMCTVNRPLRGCGYWLQSAVLRYCFSDSCCKNASTRDSSGRKLSCSSEEGGASTSSPPPPPLPPLLCCS